MDGHADAERSPGTVVGLVAVQAVVLLLVGLVTPSSDVTYWGGDPVLYQEYGQKFLSGLMPYRDFPVEYPPLALLPMALPQLLLDGTADFEAYRWLFLLQNIAISCGLAAVLALLASRSWTSGGSTQVLVAYALVVAAIAPWVAWRFDILVALLVALAMLATARDKPGWAGAALALGTLTKVYPVFLVPVFVIRHLARGETRAAGQLVLGFAVVIAAVMGPLMLLAGREAFSFVGYQLERGVQIESLVSGVVLLAHLAFDVEVGAEWAYSTWQVASPLADVLAGPLPLFTFGLLAVTGFAAFRQFRAEVRSQEGSSPGDLLVAYLLASLLIVMLTNKVLSPQYLVWLLPVVALRPMRDAYTLALAGVLSILVFPLNWQALINLDPGVILILNLRNLLLLALLISLAWEHLPEVLPRRPRPAVSSQPVN